MVSLDKASITSFRLSNVTWIKASMLTCIGWQVTLRNPTWQVMLRSSEMDYL